MVLLSHQQDFQIVFQDKLDFNRFCDQMAIIGVVAASEIAMLLQPVERPNFLLRRSRFPKAIKFGYWEME